MPGAGSRTLWRRLPSLAGAGCVVARPGGDPLGPVVPPGALPLLGGGPPLVRVGARLAADEVVRLRVPRWRHLRLDVTGGREHERRVARQQLRGPVAAVPRREMVAQPAGDVVVDLDLRQVDGRAEHLDRPRLGQQVALEDVEELAVQRTGQVRLVVVPGQDVERRRCIAHQVVVDPVVPHELVGPHPGEHRTQRPGVEDAGAARPPPGDRQQPLRLEGADHGLARPSRAASRRTTRS